MSELNKLTIAEARDALAKGQASSVELTEACLSAIDASASLNAFVHGTADKAREMARAADARIKAGNGVAMTGIPVGIKDVFCVKGVPSQAASRILQGFVPEYESTVTQNLWDAGAVMLGKLNQDEFAMGSTNETSCYGKAVNPWKAGDGKELTPADRRAARPRQLQPICALARPAPIPVVRSASPQPLPVRSACVRPMVASAAGA